MEQNLNIGITCFPSIGGSGIVASQLGAELAARGHDVHFISYERPFRVDLEKPNIHFHKVKLNEYSVFKYPDYTLPLAVKMCEVAQKNRLDIMHVHYAVPHATAALLARDICQCMTSPCQTKVITTLHGTDITLVGRDPSLQPIIQYSIEQSHGVTAVSEYLKAETYKVFPIKKNIEVIYNFFSPQKLTKGRAAIRSSLGIGLDDIVVVHSSNLRVVKRIPDVLKSFAQAYAKDKRLKLLILAGGPWSEHAPLAQQLGIDSQIIVKENVRAIENYVNASDFGLYTSEEESFGMGILESMSLGKPVIATTAGGIPEVIGNTDSNLLFPVGNIEGIAQRVVQLAADHALREELGKKALMRSMSLFSAQKIVVQYEAFYKKVLNG